MSDAEGEQLPLLAAPAEAPSRSSKRSTTGTAGLAERDPVAEVRVELAVPHLDRVLDYAVPAELAETARPGVRCTVVVAGRQAPGFVVTRKDRSDHPGLRRLHRISSALPVLTPAVLGLAEQVAAEHAGSVSDVLRLAVPPRHARTEKSVLAAEPVIPPTPDRPDATIWESFRGGVAFLERVVAGQAPRAVWTALPAADDAAGWPRALAVAALTAASAGRGSLLVVPDRRDVHRLVHQLDELDAGDLVARLTADLGPSARYRAFLQILRGERPIVVGTRGAVFAPVPRLGLAVCWDDGDDLLAEPRAPYPHARDVLIRRSELEGAAAVFGGLGRSAEAELLLHTGWARQIAADRTIVRQRAPRVVTAGDDDLRDPAARTARIPSLALRVAREALSSGPVLVQVPHAGYVPGLACQECRRPARCAHCGGPLALTARAGTACCGWCGRTVTVGPAVGPSGQWRCGTCRSTRLRAVRVGSNRTAEEIGRAFPGVPVRISSAEKGIVDGADVTGGIVVATPGAEPVVTGGYAATLLLDGWVPLSRPSLDAALEAARRWFTAAALTRPAPDGGQVVLVAESAQPAVQALVRWDPAGLAARELGERTELGLPPAGVLAEAVGTELDGFLQVLRLPAGVEVIGPLPLPLPTSDSAARQARPGDEPTPRMDVVEAGAARVLFRAPGSQRLALARALAAGGGVRSARKAALPRVRMRADAF